MIPCDAAGDFLCRFLLTCDEELDQALELSHHRCLRLRERQRCSGLLGLRLRLFVGDVDQGFGMEGAFHRLGGRMRPRRSDVANQQSARGAIGDGFARHHRRLKAGWIISTDQQHEVSLSEQVFRCGIEDRGHIQDQKSERRLELREQLSDIVIAEPAIFEWYKWRG